MRRKTTLAALICAAAALAVAPAASAEQRYVDPVFSATTVEDGVAFGEATNNRGETQTLRLDIHRPAGDTATDRAAIVLAHGGGFRSGTRKHEGFGPIVEGFAKRGYVAFSIDYRLRPSGTPGARTDPEIVAEALTGTSPTIRDAQHDMQAAVRWVRANAASLGIDPDQIAVGGESAGAITAWQTAVNPEDDGSSNDIDVPSSVSAAVSLWGAVDPDHVEAGAPPVLDVHGGADTTVPLAFGLGGCTVMTAFANTCEMVVLPQERHAPFHRADDVLAESAGFLCRRAIPGCSGAPAAPVRVR
ncbi:MAG TPA: alpha/beta hydrolase [Thermoleophilaceae bacterium]|nr:alpha/beta hydrolase [Thermoleophilaceae bacterium]